MSQATLRSCRAKYDGNLVPMTRSIGRPLLSLRSSRRQAAACGRISSFGYHLNGSATRSTAYPRAAQLRDEAADVQLGAAFDERHLRLADHDRADAP